MNCPRCDADMDEMTTSDHERGTCSNHIVGVHFCTKCTLAVRENTDSFHGFDGTFR